MILDNLYEYYQRKVDEPDSELPRRNWSREKVAWEFGIDESGKLVSVIPYEDSAAKVKSVPMTVPEHVTRSSGVRPYFLCDKAAYLMGRDAKRGEEMLEQSRELHHEILDDVDDAGARAVLAFLDEHQGSEKIEEWQEALDKGGNIVFRYLPDNRFVHERDIVRSAWETYCNAGMTGDKIQCAITGELDTPASLFPLVKGLPGAQSSGASLVSFNQEAFCSYGHSVKDQARNASISDSASFGIGSALKYLVQSREHRVSIGGSQLVFWTDRESDGENGLFSSMFDFDMRAEDEGKLEEIRAKLEGIREGRSSSDFTNETRYYLLGLAPNAARISVRLFETGTLGDYEKHLQRFLKDTEMVDWSGKALLPSRSYRFFACQAATFGQAENMPNSVVNRLMSAFVSGREFPESFYQMLLQRMRVDKGLAGSGSRKYEVMGYRAAIIKACLIRRGRLDSERSWIELNDSVDIGYRLGRLFAVLEQAQAKAVPGANSTIRDRYMGAAAATPGRVFPQLMGLSQKHLSKIRKDAPGLSRWFDKRIEEVMADEGKPVLEEFPATLDYDGQGRFYIGYYHQRAAKFDNDETTQVEGEE